MSRALWDTCCSATMSNGVKRGGGGGGVFSAILFTIYINKILCVPLGCRIGNSYVGALLYADDITLLCPSIRGLNKMLTYQLICGYGIKFTAKIITWL